VSDDPVSDAQAWRYLMARLAGWAMWGILIGLAIGAFVGCMELRLRAG
jgi:hypothetical protein